MASLFQLFGEIFINSDDADKKIDKTTEKAEKSGSSIGKVASGIGTTAAVIGTVAIAGVTALTGMALKTADAASAINDQSQKVGLSAEEYQKWSYAAKIAGVEQSSLETAMKKSQTSFSEAKQGNQGLADSYAALGINIDEMGSADEAFNASMAALAGMTDETERNKLANDLFGKSYSELAPLLNTGADGMNALKQEAEDLGGVLSNDAVSAGDKLGDTIDKLKTAGAGIMNSLGSAVIPLIQSVADMIIANLPMIQGLFEQMMPILVNLMQTLLPPIVQLAQTLLPPILNLITLIMPFIATIIEAVLPVFIELINVLLPPIMKIVEMVLPLLLALIEPLLPLLDPILALLTPLLDILMLVLEPLIQMIDFILPPLIELISGFASTYLTNLGTQLSKVAGILSGAFSGAFDNISKRVGDVKAIFTSITDFVKNVFTGNWEGAWKNIRDIFGKIVNGFKDTFKAPINGIIDLMNSLIGGINKIKVDVPDWVTKATGVKDFGFSIPKISKLKVGLDYVPSDDYPALLHRGEAVLTAEQNEKRRAGTSASGNTYAPVFNINITGTSEDTGKSLLEKLQKAVEENTFAKGGAPSWAIS